MSTAQRIREWLATQDGPRKLGEIRVGIGAAQSRRVTWLIRSMHADGYLIRTRGDAAWLYAIGKVPEPREKQSPAQRLERKREAERARNRRRGKAARTREEHLTQLAQARTAAAEKRAAEREARQAEKERARLAAEAQRLAQREAERQQRALSRQATKAHRSAARQDPAPAVAPAPLTEPERFTAPRVVERETVEAWMARTGQAPQVLPLGAVSKPLRFVGFRGDYQTTKQNRDRAA